VSVRKRLFKNIGASWLGLAATMLVGLFLTPFVLKNLGNTRFGLWVLMTTFTGYYGLLDFGFRNAILRYVARFVAQGESEELGKVASTTFATYSLLGFVVLVVSCLAAWNLNSIFKIEPQWVRDGQLLLLIFGIGTALAFPLNVFASFLEGLQLYTWIGVVQAAAALLRAGLIVVFLTHGYGLVTVGVLTVTTNLVAAMIYVVVARRHCPVRLRWQNVSKKTLTTLGAFGVVTFWIGIAQTLRFQSDAIVIGAFLSVQAISLFSIGSKLVTYATEAVQVMAGVFTPMFSHFDAKEDSEQLQRTLIRANAYSTLVVMPIAIILIVSGKSIIRVWVGTDYLASYSVLVILMVASALYLAQAGSTKVLYGMAKHRFLAYMLLAEGIANLGLSIILLRHLGINGVAWGTAIPLAINSLFVLPVYTCRTVKLPLVRYFCHAHLYPSIVSLPFIFVLCGLEYWIKPTTYFGLLAELLPTLLIYGIALLLFLYRGEDLSQSRMMAGGDLPHSEPKVTR
jgi:O-antigen/teichoic acid export membrane protein